MEHTSSFALKSPFLSSFRGTSALLRMDDLIERCLKVLPAHESLVIVLLRKAILRGHRLQCAGNPNVKTLIRSYLPQKKMSSATNIGTSPMINTYITLNNPSKTSGWSLKTLYPPGNMAGNTNYRRFSRSLHLWGMFRPAQLWVWPHRKPCMNQSWLVKQVTWRDTYSTVHTCPGSLTYSNLCEAIHSSTAPISLFVSGYLLFRSVARLRGGKKVLGLCPYNSPSNLRSWFQSSSGNGSKFQTHLCPLSTSLNIS